MATTDLDPRLSWNLADMLRQLFAFDFMVNAFRAGTIVAVLAGAIGWFMIIRRETFAGHSLSVVGFPGAACALWLGVSTTLGYNLACGAAALLFAWTQRRTGSLRLGGAEGSAAIGTLQAFALASGLLFISLSEGKASGVITLLFGNFLSVTDSQVSALLATAAIALAVVAVLGRPLMFASIDIDVASARGVPVAMLSAVFLLVLGMTVAQASQITGSLLVFALLVVPPATAQVVTANARASLVLSMLFGVVVVWVGLAISYFSDAPAGFWIATVAFTMYLTARVGASRGRGVVSAAS